MRENRKKLETTKKNPRNSDHNGKSVIYEKLWENTWTRNRRKSEKLRKSTITKSFLYIPLKIIIAIELNAKLAWTPCIKVSFCFAYRLDNSFLEVAERLALPNVATFSQLFCCLCCFDYLGKLIFLVKCLWLKHFTASSLGPSPRIFGRPEKGFKLGSV